MRNKFNKKSAKVIDNLLLKLRKKIKEYNKLIEIYNNDLNNIKKNKQISLLRKEIFDIENKIKKISKKK